MPQMKCVVLAGIFLAMLTCLRLIVAMFENKLNEDLPQITHFVEKDLRSPEESSPSSSTYLNPTRIIRGDDPWPPQHGENDHTWFRPGTLNMTHLEAMRYCFVNPKIYRHHWQRGSDYRRSRNAYSEQHKLLYWMIAKSGSSGAKRMMQNHFDGYVRKIPMDLQEYHKFSFVREPVSRFVSSFNEMLFRDGPWKTRQRGCNKNYPFLFQNMTGQKDVLRSSGLKGKNPDEYTELMRRFDYFVKVYNGRKPCNGHMRMQVTRLLHVDKRTEDVELFPIDEIYSIKKWRDVWVKLSETRNVSIPEPEYHRAIKSSPSYINSRILSNGTTRAVCHLMAVDYCCLNFPLPPPCAEDDKPVYCAVVQRGGRRRIKTWADFPPPSAAA